MERSREAEGVQVDHERDRLHPNVPGTIRGPNFQDVAPLRGNQECVEVRDPRTAIEPVLEGRDSRPLIFRLDPHADRGREEARGLHGAVQRDTGGRRPCVDKVRSEHEVPVCVVQGERCHSGPLRHGGKGGPAAALPVADHLDPPRALLHSLPHVSAPVGRVTDVGPIQGIVRERHGVVSTPID